MVDRDAGGGRDDMNSIKNQIMSWWGQSNWADMDQADRASEEFTENFDKYIDPTLSASANWEIVKQEFNLTTVRDEQTEYADRGDELYGRARNTVFDSIDEYGVDEWVRAVNDDPYDEPRPEVAAVRDDVLAGAADLGITPDTLRDWVMDHLESRLNALGGTFEPRTVFDPEQAKRIERDTRADVVRRIQNRYGVAGGADDLDDVLSALEDRFRREGGPDVQTAPIIVRTSVDDTYSLSFDVSPERARTFDAYRSDVRDQLEREIGAQAIIDAPGKRYTVGTIRLENGELAGIDLTDARDRFGAQGPPAAPAGRAGWNKTSDSQTRVTYEKPEAITRSEGATRTVLVVAYDDERDRWELIIEEREPADAGGDVVAMTPEQTGADALPTREAALDVAGRYMEDNEFDADRATAQAGADVLDALLKRAAAGWDALAVQTDDDEWAQATAALDAGLGGDTARELAGAIDRVAPTMVAESLAQERATADGPGDTPLFDFLDALPGYQPPRPEPEQQSGVDARELTDEERGARGRIRSVIEAGPDGDERDPLAFYDRLESALRQGRSPDPALISQRDLDVLSQQLRNQLADEVARLREEVRRSNLQPSDFPNIHQQVQYVARTGNEQTVRKAIDILNGERENEDAYFVPDELERAQSVDHVIDEMVDIIRRGYENRMGGGQPGGNRGLGGFNDGPAEPGMSDDDFREYQDDAADYQYGSGGSAGGGSRRGTGARDGDTYSDESYRSGEEVIRRPAFEQRFEALVKDLGERRRFPSNWVKYWRLTRAEQEVLYDRVPEGWLRYFVRSGRATRSQLYNRGFAPEVIPPESDDEYATRDRLGEEYTNRFDDDNLTPGEKAVRDAIEEDSDVSDAFGSLFDDDDQDDDDQDDDDQDEEDDDE